MDTETPKGGFFLAQLAALVTRKPRKRVRLRVRLAEPYSGVAPLGLPGGGRRLASSSSPGETAHRMPAPRLITLHCRNVVLALKMLQAGGAETFY